MVERGRFTKTRHVIWIKAVFVCPFSLSDKFLNTYMNIFYVFTFNEVSDHFTILLIDSMAHFITNSEHVMQAFAQCYADYKSDSLFKIFSR